MTEPGTAPPTKPDAGPKGRRSRILVAVLVAWALLASVGFGWMWNSDVQHQAAINATLDSIVLDMGSDFLSASVATQLMLEQQSLSDGGSAAQWLSEVRSRVSELYPTSDGLMILQALNVTSGSIACPYLAYTQILALADSNMSLLNGTTPYTTYFALAQNLTDALGHNLWSIVGATSGAPVQLDSPSMPALRAEFLALFVASIPFSGGGCSY